MIPIQLLFGQCKTFYSNFFDFIFLSELYSYFFPISPLMSRRLSSYSDFFFPISCCWSEHPSFYSDFFSNFTLLFRRLELWFLFFVILGLKVPSSYSCFFLPSRLPCSEDLSSDSVFFLRPII